MNEESIFWPPYAYRPGQNRRHPDNLFDVVKASVQPGSTADQLANSRAFRHGLAYLDKGFCWEAHEVLEPVWMALEDGSTERRFVQALIQTANAHLKSAMGWPKAALRLIAIAEGLLPDGKACMGVDIGFIRARLIDLKSKNMHYNAK